MQNYLYWQTFILRSMHACFIRQLQWIHYTANLLTLDLVKAWVSLQVNIKVYLEDDFATMVTP